MTDKNRLDEIENLLLELTEHMKNMAELLGFILKEVTK